MVLWKKVQEDFYKNHGIEDEAKLEIGEAKSYIEIYVDSDLKMETDDQIVKDVFEEIDKTCEKEIMLAAMFEYMKKIEKLWKE